MVLALDVPDFEGAVSLRNQERGQRRAKPLLVPGTRVVNVGLDDLLVRGWSADANRLRQADLMVMADTAVFLPELVKRLQGCAELGGLAPRITERRASWTALHERKAATQDRERRAEWDATPVSMGRLCGDLETVLEGERWMLASGSSQGKENHYLPASRFNQILGRYQGAGVGYGLPASVGAALALKGTGVVCVDLQPDGCLLYTAGGLWTAVHHAIPLLVVVCNNRSYYNDEEHQERVAHARGRPVENKTIGISLDEPAVDFAALARSYGCWARGPIFDPQSLLGTLREAVKIVKEGRPALVDVVCQMR
jgi:benzoylformate decarboxylase/acetolactate synthase-1/2/3 large subunit